MQAPIFKRGDKVKFATPRYPRGRGEVTKITKTSKGVWYSVAGPGGMTIKMRAASLSAV